ncbi:SPOR domain-containing protein [Methylomicrobium sp. RS1]|uniref:SPOR domain-containing protein n=1 Tax=Candidatus Methylomicrobium oryzae TaxID=2802053 RepID=UPI00192197BD|nr:SPOR domain-containing protein [Methylomicrobium sp. RS1]MBL1262389.1 SPOR domain-containing protein [Methylomicrobium sp. RS1]
MDQELKQRLIGAAVVTALAAIFIPMLFDDPVDTSGQAVSEMTIPEPPAGSPNGPESKLPTDAASIESASGNALSPAASPSGNNPSAATLNVTAGGVEKIEPGLQENAPADYEPPAEVDVAADAENAPDEDIEAVPPAPAPEPTIDRTSPAAVSPVETAAPKTAPVPRRTESVSESAAVEPVPLEPAETPAKAAPKSAAKFERWNIQAGSFTKKENALSQRDKLRKLGFPAALETLSTDKGPIYRLKIGPELSKQRALEIRNRLNQQNIKTIILAE